MKTLPEMPKHALLRVTWIDSNYAKGWHHAKEQTAEVPEIVTVGFMTHADATVLEITSSIGDDGGKLNPLSIPLVAIHKVEGLKGIEDAAAMADPDVVAVSETDVLCLKGN